MTSPPNLMFQYNPAATDKAEVLRTIAGRIRLGVRTTIGAIFSIGHELLAAKDLLEHGQFNHWVRSECGFSPRTAERFMRVVLVLGPKSDRVSFLQPATLYKLTAKSVPTEVVSAVIDRLSSSTHMLDSDVIDIIDQTTLRKPATRATVTTTQCRLLLSAWESASESDRTQLIALKSEDYFRTAWRLSSKAARERFVRDCRDEIEPLLLEATPKPDVVPPSAKQECIKLLCPPSKAPEAVTKPESGNLEDGIPDFLRRADGGLR